MSDETNGFINTKPENYIVQAQAEYHVTEVPATLPANSGSVLRVVPKEETGADVDFIYAEELATANLDAKIDELIATPEVQAMIDNAVQGVVDNAVDDAATLVERFPDAEYKNLREEFYEFKERVEKAFKHAGFKF